MVESDRHIPNEASLQRLAEVACAVNDGEVSGEAHARGRERLLDALEARAARAALPLAPRPWLLVAASLVALGLALVLLWPRARLDYTLHGAPAADGYVQAGASGAEARFSEGSQIRFAPRARGRIAAVTDRGAVVQIEAGKVSLQVTHLPAAAWSIVAGPFTIAVIGTEFDVAWVDERLEIDLHAGAVMVRGPLVTDGIALRAGQRLVADVARGELTVSGPGGLGASASPPSPPPPASAVAGAQPLIQGPFHPPPPARDEADPSPRPAPATWRARLAGGDFAGVLAEADARGLEAVLKESSLSDLAALADAARYAGRTDLARRALLAERARFPGSAEARSAAFLLGRMVEGATPAAAIGWYDQYLTESPGGSLVAEALGRKMVAVDKASGRDAARPIAEEYLRRFPQGMFAAVAEGIAEPR